MKPDHFYEVGEISDFVNWFSSSMLCGHSACKKSHISTFTKSTVLISSLYSGLILYLENAGEVSSPATKYLADFDMK